MYVQSTSSISRSDLARSHSVVSDVPQFSQTVSFIGTHPYYQPSYSSAYVLQHTTAYPAHTSVSDVTPTESSVQLHSSGFNIHSSIPNTITSSSSEAFSAGGGETAVHSTGMTPALQSNPSLEHTSSIINPYPTAMYSNALGEMASGVNSADNESPKQSSPSYHARSEIDEFSQMHTVMSSSITVNGQTKVTSPVIVSASTAYDGHAESSQLTSRDEYSSPQAMLPGASKVSDGQDFFLSTTENVMSTPISTYSQYNTDIHVSPAYSDEYTDLLSFSYETGVMTMASVVMSHGTLQASPSSAIAATDDARVTSIELPPQATVFGDSSGVHDVSDALSSLQYDDHRTSMFASMSAYTRASFVDTDSIYTVANPTFTSVARTSSEPLSSSLWHSTERTSSGTVGVSQTRHDQTATVLPAPLASSWSQTTTTIMPSPLLSAGSHTTTSLQQTQLLTTLYVNKSSPIEVLSSYTVTSPDITFTTRPAIEPTSYTSWNSIEYTTNIPVVSSAIPNDIGSSETFQGSFDETASIMSSSLNHVPTGIPVDTTFVHTQTVPAFIPTPSSSYQTGSTSVSAYTSSHALPSASFVQLNQSSISFHESATISHSSSTMDDLITSLHDQYLTVTPSFGSDSIYPERSADDDAITSLQDDYLTITPVFVSDTIYHTRSAQGGPSTSLFDQYLTVSPPFASDTIYISRSAEVGLSSSMYDPYLTFTPSLDGTSIYPESSPTGDHSTPFSDQYLTVTPSLGSDANYLKSSPLVDISASANDPFTTVSPSLVSDTIYPKATVADDYITSMNDSHLTVMPSVGSGTIYPKSSSADDLSPSMYDPTLTVTPSFVSEPTLLVTSTYDTFSTATPSLDSDITSPESSSIDGLVTSMQEQYSTVTPLVSYVSATLTTAAESDASMTDSIRGSFTTVITSATAAIDLGSSLTSIPVYSLSSSLQESIDGSATIMAWTSTPSSMLPSSATPSVSESEQWSFVATATESLPLTSSVTASPPLTSSVTASLPLNTSVTASLPLTSSVTVSLPLTSSVTASPPLPSSVTASLPPTSSDTASLALPSSVTASPPLTSSVTASPPLTSSVTAFLPLTSSVPYATTVITSSLPTSDVTTGISSSLSASTISSQVWMMVNVRHTRLHVTPPTGAACAAHGFCTRLSLSLESTRDIRGSLCTVADAHRSPLGVMLFTHASFRFLCTCNILCHHYVLYHRNV